MGALFLHNISVIIASQKHPKHLDKVLESLCDQTSPAGEIIVTHTGRKNMSNSVLAGYRHRLPIKFFFEPGKPASHARNKAVSVTTGSILVFLNDTCVPCRHWIAAIKSEFGTNQKLQALQGKISHNREDRSLSSIIDKEEHKRWMDAVHDKTHGHISEIDARNFAVRRHLIGRFRMPFDERLETNDGMDFCWKLRQEGVRIGFSVDMEVSLCQKKGAISFLKDWHRYGFGKGQLRKIHDDFWDHFCVGIKSFSGAVLWAGGEIQRNWSKKFFSRLLEKRDFFKVFGLFPLVFMQKIALVMGLFKGQKQNLPCYGHLVTPIDLLFFLTNQCNIRCKHCFFHQNLSEDIQQISVDHVVKILEGLNRDLRNVILAGGEPFLNDDLVDICIALNEKIHVTNVYILTNGFDTSRIVKSVEKILEKTNYNLFLRVSLDGMSDTHNRIRQNRRSFEHAVETIRELRKLSQQTDRLKAEILTTVMRDNFDEVESLAAFAANELNVFLAFEIIRDSTTAYHNQPFMQPCYGPQDLSMLLTPDQLKRVEKHVRHIYNRYFTNERFSRYQVDYQAFLVQINSQQLLLKKRLLPCTSGESMAVIFQNYDTAICEMTHPIGNLLDFDLDLNRLLKESFSKQVRDARNDCYCTNSCNNSSAIQTAREFSNIMEPLESWFFK
jgi:MoaA/NifB/PqqE/SkfB family radical SAM enzyme